MKSDQVCDSVVVGGRDRWGDGARPVASAAPAPGPHNNVIAAEPSPGASGEDPLVPNGTDPQIPFQTAITTRPCRTIPATRTQAAASAYHLDTPRARAECDEITSAAGA